MQSRIQGPVFNLEYILRTMLNRMGNRVPVGWTENQRLKDQHVESPLEHLTLEWGFTPRHMLHYTPLDHLSK